MKVKIDRVPYPSLRNDEFPVVYGQTVSICEKHDMQSLHLEKSFGELISFRPSIESLTVYLRKNTKQTQISELDFERDTLANAVVRTVRGIEHVTLPQVRSHYETLEALLSKHSLKTVATDTRAAETERLQRFETDVNADDAVQTAFAALGLTPVITRLFETNREYEATFREYIADKSLEQHVDVSLLRRNCSKALIQFLDAVQYSAYVYEEPDYTPLINELIKLNQYYIQQLKARATRRKNGKATGEEPPIPPMTA